MAERYILRFGRNTWYIGEYGHHLMSGSDFIFRKLLPIKESPEHFIARNIFSKDGHDAYKPEPRYLKKGFRISVVSSAAKDKLIFLGGDPMKNRDTNIEEVYRLIEG